MRTHMVFMFYIECIHISDDIFTPGYLQLVYLLESHRNNYRSILGKIWLLHMELKTIPRKEMQQ